LGVPHPEQPPESVEAFVDDHRVRALWFLRDDYYPRSDAELLKVVEQVEKHGDLQAFRRAAAIRRWLSQRSSDTSAG
jgi:hypothetical protein